MAAMRRSPPSAIRRGLIAQINDIAAKALRELECRNADFTNEFVDETGDEEPDARLCSARSAAPRYPRTPWLSLFGMKES
jgi:hypothetical protein